MEIDNLRLQPWAIALPRYTSDNRYMVDRGRPSRTNIGNGMKLFDGNPVGSLENFNGSSITVDELRNYYRVWRPEETVEAAHVLKEHGRLLVVGRPQSGKGTILFGLSEICDKQQIGYLMIDGHWLEAPTEQVIQAIEKADQEGKMIFYDSFDYLFAGSNKLRKQNKETHSQRTREIISALQKTTTPLVLTAHDEYWAKLVLNPALLEEHRDFLQTLGIYNLPRYIESEESRLAFLIDHEFELEQACKLLNFPNTDLTKSIISKTYRDSKYEKDLYLALQDYGVLKKLARREDKEIYGLPDQVKDLLVKIDDGNPSAIKELIDIVLSLHFESDLAATLRWSK